MAQETKVGLVVGLGFIVCFATILANRGGDRIRRQMPYELFDRPATLRGGAGVTLPPRPAASADKSEHRTAPGNTPPTEPDRAASRGNPAGVPGTIADPDQFKRRRAPIPKPLDLPEPVYADAHDPDEEDMSYMVDASEGPYAAGVSESPTSGQMRTLAAESVLPESLQPYADQFERPGARRLANSARGARPSPVATHVVQPGDSLGKIARRYYGTGSVATVKAIFEANRNVLKSRDTVVIGNTLRLPLLNGVPPDPTAAEASALAKSPGDDTTQPDFRWHKVQKGEMLGTIAQRLLGSSKRWKEIMALNQDICPNPRRLQAGMEIRIPLDTFADAR